MKIFQCLCFLLIFTAGQSARANPELPPPPALPEGIPDLTKGEGPSADQAKNDWYLHCGGTRGWIYRDEKGRANKARQILITKVPIDSAVRRQLDVGDVILGVNGKYFSRQAVFEFRDATKPVRDVGGKFEAIVWRKAWQKPRRVMLDLAHKPLDFTKGDKPGLAVDWNLGPTGARGWMEGQHEESIMSRQILITKIHQDSPADGVLEVGDVILGIDGKDF